eukprot:COSAG06_NODE_254_length_19039_cov_5.465488_12_plen_64_part_00
MDLIGDNKRKLQKHSIKARSNNSSNTPKRRSRSSTRTSAGVTHSKGKKGGAPGRVCHTWEWMR